MTDEAITIADHLLAGDHPVDIPGELLDEPDAPTPMAQIRAIERQLTEALDDECMHIRSRLEAIDGELATDEAPELWKSRHELTQNRDHLFSALDCLLSVAQSIPCSDEESLQFYGWKCAEVSSRRGKVQRWTELRLHRTLNHQWVCEEVGVSRVPGEVDRRKVDVVDTDFHVTRFFGDGPLSEPIYEAVGIVSLP